MAKFNSTQLLNKVVKYGDRLTGNTRRKLDTIAGSLEAAPRYGIRGIPQATVNKANRLAKDEGRRVNRTRVATGIAATAAVGGGFLGLHKYHQHRDNKILERIDNMGKKK